MSLPSYKDSKITLNITSKEWTKKEEVAAELATIKRELEGLSLVYGFDPSDNLSCAIETMEELVNADPVEMEFTNLEPIDLFNAMDDVDVDIVSDYTLDSYEDDIFYNHLLTKEYPGVKPTRACDVNDYDFKRYLSDLFEVGYHTPSADLLRLMAERIDKGWALVF